MNRIAKLALLCCVLSCSGNEDPDAAGDAAPAPGICPGIPTIDSTMLPTEAPDSALLIFLISPKRFGDTESSLADCLGTPPDVTVDTVANIHTGEPDNVLQITYPGIKYSIYRVLADGKEILFRVEAFAATDELAFGIRVGVPWSHVIEELGAPASETQNAAGVLTARYVVDYFVEETVTFRVEDGIVSRISWDYYID